MKIKDYLQNAKSGSSSRHSGPDSALVQRHFDAVALHYDLVNTIMSLGSHYPLEAAGHKAA